MSVWRAIWFCKSDSEQFAVHASHAYHDSPIKAPALTYYDDDGCDDAAGVLEYSWDLSALP